MSDLPTPITREEQFLNGIAQGDTSNLPSPVTREEKYLDHIAKNGGGGGGGTTNYNALDNKPQIAGTTLQGNKTLADLGIASASDVTTALANKVDKVQGKELSTNDYSDTEKGKVTANAEAIEAMVNVTGSCNVLPNNAKSQTIAEGTITVNSDGSIRTNISATNGVAYDITDYFTVPSGDYIFSKGMSLIQSQIWLQFFNGSTFVKDVKLKMDASKPIVIDYDGYTQIKCVGYIPPNTTIDTTVYPMLYDARLTPTGYVPYAMTNRELTEKTLKFVKISKSSFAWDSSNKCFYHTNPPSEVTRNKGFIVNPLNGMACMNAYYSTVSGYLFVIGWIPVSASSIDENYDFDCYILT